jgi:hypothetical protein
MVTDELCYFGVIDRRSGKIDNGKPDKIKIRLRTLFTGIWCRLGSQTKRS